MPSDTTMPRPVLGDDSFVVIFLFLWYAKILLLVSFCDVIRKDRIKEGYFLNQGDYGYPSRSVLRKKLLYVRGDLN